MIHTKQKLNINRIKTFMIRARIHFQVKQTIIMMIISKSLKCEISIKICKYYNVKSIMYSQYFNLSVDSVMVKIKYIDSRLRNPYFCAPKIMIIPYGQKI